MFNTAGRLIVGVTAKSMDEAVITFVGNFVACNEGECIPKRFFCGEIESWHGQDRVEYSWSHVEDAIWRKTHVGSSGRKEWVLIKESGGEYA